MSIPDQTIAKLHHYDPLLDREFEQIYHFLQFSRFPPDSIEGDSLKVGGITQSRLRPPIGANSLILDDDGDLRINGAVALGAGPVATLGLTGGSGPTAAAQVEWLEIEVNGVTRFVATWA